MTNTGRERAAAVLPLTCLLLVSGACALIFQLVWTRELRLVFGATTAASAAVLSIFMGGIGLGNWLLGRVADRTSNPLRLYGLLEAGVALSAAATPLLIEAARSLYLGVGAESPAGATALRLLGSTIALAAPTFLMGGTLPAAAKAASVDSDKKRRAIGLIYSGNTLGAVLGAGLANFVLLEALGNRATLWAAACANVLLAGTALGYARWLRSRGVAPDTAREAGETGGAPQERVGAAALWPLGLVSVVAGFAFFSMEIVWYRMLGPLLGGTTFTFGLILCVALLGVAIGGGLYAALARFLVPSLGWVGLTCALEAAALSAPFFAGDRIALWTLSQNLASDGAFWSRVSIWFWVTAAVVGPAAMVAGFQFPMIIAAAGAGRRDVAKHVGRLFSANTAGAIAGSLVCGFWALPLLTAPGLWRGCGCLLALTGLIAAWNGRGSGRGLAALSLAVSVATVVMLCAEGPTPVWRHSGIGAGRAQLPIKAGRSLRNAETQFVNLERRLCVWEAEGVESSVAISRRESTSFVVNGKTDGSALGDAGTQVGLGLIGPLLHPSAEAGLVIGLGTGESAGWLAATAHIQSVDVVEIEPSIREIAKVCAEVNHNVLENPKVHLEFADAREFVRRPGRVYDLIVSEPSNPYRAGVASLFTAEFYEAARARLAPDGLFLQWLQAYEVDPSTVAVVLRTLRDAFPHVEAWRTLHGDTVLVCGRDAPEVSREPKLWEQSLNDSVVRGGLEKTWGVTDVAGVRSRRASGVVGIDTFLRANPATPNTDDHNRLEYSFAKSVGRPLKFSTASLFRLASEAGDPDIAVLAGVDAAVAERRRVATAFFMFDEDHYPESPSPTAARLIQAFDAYRGSDIASAAAAFADVPADLTCPIESSARACCLAKSGADLPEDLMEAVRGASVAEATAIEAISHATRTDTERVFESIETLIGTLRESPWGNSAIIKSALELAGPLAKRNPEHASRLYDRLSRPFALGRLEDERNILRLIVAQHLGATSIAGALAALEPHVPWNEPILAARLKAYATLRHPLTARARADMIRFQSQADDKARGFRRR